MKELQVHTFATVEDWKDVLGYEGFYEVSNTGRVKSLGRFVIARAGRKRYKKESILKPGLRHGYELVGLCIDNKQETKMVHKLVAIAFLNHVPCRYKEIVDHINNIRTDNRLENLQLISHRENCSKDRKGGSSKYVGVSWNKSKSNWACKIQIKGENINLGYFKTEIEAHNAYQREFRLSSQK